MKYIDLSFPPAEYNLACDEALLDMCEQGYGHEILRVWEPASCFVVLGYSNRASTEVDEEACRAAGVPVFRRHSGGGTVLQGPGCLDYALILRISPDGPLATIGGANRYIMNRMRHAVEGVAGTGVEVQGYTDLTIRGVKFSGNAQRRLSRFLLFHGVLLLNFNIASVSRLLPLPSRQPSYRHGRSHERFLRNLNVPSPIVKQALRDEWQAEEEPDRIPSDRIADLARTRYASPEWIYRQP